MVTGGGGGVITPEIACHDPKGEGSMVVKPLSAQDSLRLSWDDQPSLKLTRSYCNRAWHG